MLIWVSSSVLFFRADYIHSNFLESRFNWLVFSFVARIILLITRLNFISIFLGWDGLGITSFLLVIFYNNNTSNKAGIITALTNRIGDISIILLIPVALHIGSVQFMPLSIWLREYSLLVFLLILARITKRAQIPFSAWLPAAIAAPTPVRALVHSSTLVTAGVYLLIRFSPPQRICITLLIIALLTSTIASLRACAETDLKKVIALSTLSQLGVIITAVASGLPNLAFFHLISHASFKALLFISAGKVLGETSTQDSRLIGNLWCLPVTSVMFNLTSLSLCGLPFLSGFYSKDLIIESLISSSFSPLILLLYSAIIILSAIYSFRLLQIVLSAPHNSLNPLLNSKEVESKTLLSYFILSFTSVFSGSLLSWSLFPSPQITILSIASKLRITPLILISIISTNYITLNNNSKLKPSSFLRKIWLLPLFSFSAPPYLSLPLSLSLKKINITWLELLGPLGINSTILNSFFLTPWRILNKRLLLSLSFFFIILLTSI